MKINNKIKENKGCRRCDYKGHLFGCFVCGKTRDLDIESQIEENKEN